jgi:hypothetical protein
MFQDFPIRLALRATQRAFPIFQGIHVMGILDKPAYIADIDENMYTLTR